MMMLKRLAYWGLSRAAMIVTLAGERIIGAGAWLTKQAKHFLPIAALYLALNLLRATAAAGLISVPVVPVLAIRSVWSSAA